MSAIFVASHDWQDVPDGAVLPPGCQVRMNLNSGRKEARWANGHANGKAADPLAGLDEAYDDAAGGEEPAGEVTPQPGAASVLGTAALDLQALSDREPPPRESAWHPWVPAGQVTLLHSYGGVGKSLLCQQLATGYALGRDVLGGATKGRPALFLAGEDDHDEVWRRQLSMCRRFNVSLEELSGSLDLLAAPHLDLTIAVCDESGMARPTPLFYELRERIKAGQHGLAILDNSAKLFAVKEGDRIGVTRCVGLLNSICQELNTTIVLVAHDNKTGEFSGSTAWENTCRSRLHLKRKDAGIVSMTMPKANYSALGQIDLIWDDWSFTASSPEYMTEAERIEADKAARGHAETFLRALDELTRQGCNTSGSPNAQNYAPKIMVQRKLVLGMTKEQVEAAMLMLLREGRILENQPVVKGSDRHWRYGIARSPEPAAEPAEGGSEPAGNTDGPV